MAATKKVKLFYCKEYEGLARRVAEVQSDAIELKPILWNSFEDGFPNLFIPNAGDIQGQHIAFLASFSSPGVIFEQMSIMYELPRLFSASFTVVVPFFPTGTSERVDSEGDVATAFTLSRVLSDIPPSRGGPTSVVIFDIHALQKVLLANGASKVSAFVTHGVFPRDAWKQFVHNEGELEFSHFWITDSCASTVEAVRDKRPFEVLSLAGEIASALQI